MDVTLAASNVKSVLYVTLTADTNCLYSSVLPLSWLASWDPQSEVKSENESVSDVRVRKRFNNSLQDFWVKKG